MKTVFLSIFFLFLGVVCFAQTIPEADKYLGQTPPGSTPKIFNLSISSGYFAAERVTISNDGKEIYYSELNGYNPNSNVRVKYYSYSGGKWSGPTILFENYFSPTLSVDGNKMFLQKMGNTSQEVWCSTKSGSSWNTPVKFMPSQTIDYMVWETNNGNLYFGSRSAKGGLGQLDWSELIINGNDTTVQSLGAPLCTSGDDVDFCVSSNDSIIIISSGSSNNRQAYGHADLFISYKKMDGTWTNPINLGTTININDPKDGRWAPCLTSDKKYLFYSGGWYSPAIYWVSSSFIDSLKIYTSIKPTYEQNIHISKPPSCRTIASCGK